MKEYLENPGMVWFLAAMKKSCTFTGGNDNWILGFHLQDNKLGKADTIRLGKPWPKNNICPTGMAVNKNNPGFMLSPKETARFTL